MRDGTQLTYEAALEEVTEACPNAFHEVLLEPMTPEMVSEGSDDGLRPRRSPIGQHVGLIQSIFFNSSFDLI